MRYALLGPLTVVDAAGTPMAVAGGRVRVLLAALLLHANTPVSADALAELVWDGAPSPGYAATLRSHVRRLRKALGPEEILTCAPGYVIRLEESDLDVLLFEALGRRTDAAVGRRAWRQAWDVATEGLALWRAPPLLDVPSQTLRDRVVPRLEQLRLRLLEHRAGAGLHLGRHEDLVPALRELAAEHPLREHVHAQLMLALAGAGRQAEALTAYQDARRVLVDELGIEPGPELQALHRRILAGERELLAPPSPASPPAAPRQLPARVGHFVGRASELKVLSGLLAQQPAASGTVVISAIDGTAGIGKTALAVHFAHEVAERFPDGQLYVNLRGFDPSGPPMTTADAVHGFLTALDVPARRVPVDPAEQAALYRSELADRRMLIVLDNARDDEQVRPLLPGSHGCLVMVTSRSRLGGLVALDGAVPLSLDLLTRTEARDLLIRRLGHERVLTEERAVGELIELCARLPLALNIAAANAALRPARPLSRLVAELRDARRRLDVLAVGEGAAAVRVVFSWSYRALGSEAARVFRLLGLHPGPDIGLEAAASLAARDLDDTRRALAELTHAHLLTEHAPGRYGFHDLLRAYASDQGRDRDGEAARQEALRRMCDFYLHTAFAATLLLEPKRRPIRLAAPASGVHHHPLPDESAAAAWFEAEYANLLASQQDAAERGLHLATWQLAWTLNTHHRRHGRLRDQLTVWQSALASAAHLPDLAARTIAERFLGRACAESGRIQDAIEHMAHALALAERHHDLIEQAHAHDMLAWARGRQGDGRQALHHAERALELYRTFGEPVWEAQALNSTGWFAARLGDHDTARAHCRAALALYREHDKIDGEAATLDSLGYIEYLAGRHARAVEHYQHAVRRFRSCGNAYLRADALDHLGHPHVALGHREQARTVWRQALDLYQEQGRPQDAARIRHQLETLDPR